MADNKFLKQPKKELSADELVSSIGAIRNAVIEVEKVKEDVIETVNQKIEEVDTKVQDLVENTLTIIEDTKTEAISLIKDNKGEKGEPGRDGINGVDGKPADEQKITKAVLAKIPKVSDLAKQVLKAIPENKASLKIIQEKFETDPMSVIDKILSLGNQFKLKPENIDGLEQTISSFRNQLSTRGYLHGGGDTVVAGTNITIATNAQGQKVISATASGSVVSVTGTAPITVNNTDPANPVVSVTGSALTRTDDTNITLTLGGSPSTALLAATSLTLGWTGQLSLARGGTGANLSDPEANKLWGWDDTDNSVGFWTLGSGLSYDHATHTISASGSSGISIGDTVTGGTEGSVLFLGASNVLAQDNANFFWDDTNNRLGIGSSSPGAKLQVNTADAAIIGEIVKGAVSQSANLQQWQNSSGTVLAFIGVTSNEPRLYLVDPGDSVGRYLYAGNGSTILGKIGLEASGSSGGLYFSAEDNVRHIEFYRPASNELGIKTGGTERVRINSTGIGVLTSSLTAALDINSDILRLRTAKTPSSASDTGNQGDIAWDSDFIYVCVTTNTWKRSPITTWV